MAGPRAVSRNDGDVGEIEGLRHEPVEEAANCDEGDGVAVGQGEEVGAFLLSFGVADAEVAVCFALRDDAESGLLAGC